MDGMAERMKVLGNQHRLQILRRLVDCCPPGTSCAVPGDRLDGLPCVADLGTELGIAGSTLSHHLKELERVGLIHRHRRGQQIHCAVGEDAVVEIARFFQDLANTCCPPGADGSPGCKS